MKNQQKSTQVLRFGQVIRIHGNYHDWRQGLLTAKGFTDRNVYYLAYENFSYINNYRESLFQVLPKGSFEIHDEFSKSTTTVKVKENLLLRLKTEQDQYKAVIQNKFDEEILFGSEVLFKHIDSEQYLVSSYKCSEFSTDAFKLELTDQLGSLAVFKIQPFHSYQQEGQHVFLEEPVKIQHEKSKCLVDFVQDMRVFIDEHVNFQFEEAESELEQQAYERFRLQVRKPIVENKRYEGVATHNCQTNWVIRLHDQGNQDKMVIKPFDLCIFKHTENNSYLSVEGHSNRCILKELKDQNYTPLEAVWELQPIEMPQKREMLVQKNQITSSPRVSCCEIQISKGYILRHCLTGKVLTSTELIRDGSYGVTVEDIDLLNRTQLFEVVPAKRGTTDLLVNSFVKIIDKGKELQLKQIERKSMLIKRENSFSSFSNYDIFFKSLDEENLDFSKYHVCFQSNESMHAFQVYRVSDEIKNDLFYIMSSQEMLMQFSDILKLSPQEVEDKLDSKILGQIVQILRHLLQYVLNLKDADVEKSECLPLPHRQRYLKDLYMTELVMEILFFMSYKNGLEKLFKQWKSERERTKQIFKLSYLLIEKMTKNNPQIKLHVSQWLELFLHQAMMIDDASVQASLSELLDDNYQAISKFINKTSIKRLIDIMRLQIPHEKYLRILSSICICNGKSIINNQIHALTLFYQQIQPEFKFELRQNDSSVQVLSYIAKKDPRWRTLKQLYEDSMAQDELQTWNYFLGYFNLLGDVCANRNKFAKRYVEEHFSLETLCVVIEDPDCMGTNAMEPFLKVIHFAYIDCQHYVPIRRLARVREWGTIEKKNDILRTHAVDNLKPENCDLQRVMNFIEKFLQEFKFFSTKNKNYNQNLYTILQVLKTTLCLGFWKSIINLRAMLPHLFRICSCNKDFSEYLENSEQFDETPLSVQQEKTKEHFEKAKAKLTKMNLDNMMVMKCKILACEILDIMIDMETNVRVSKTTQTLKKLIEIEEDQPGSNLFKRKSDQEIYKPEVWIEHNRQLISDRRLFPEEIVYELVFAEMSLFENGQMLQWGLQLLNRMYGQRRELWQNFEKVLIVADGITYTLSVDSRVTRTKLLALVDRNILQCTLDNQKDFNVFLWRESENPKDSGIIQDLQYLVYTLKRHKQSKKRTDIVIEYDRLYPENGLMDIFNEREQSHKLHQSLLKSQDLHESILSFIQISRDVQRSNDLIMKVLHSCYNYLRMLVINHSENKLDLMKHMSLMYTHLAYNIGCVEFFRELFHNNKALLFSEKELVKTAEILIQYANTTMIYNFFKTRLLDTFRVFVLYNNKAIKTNQVMVLAKLQEKQNMNLMFHIPKTSFLTQDAQPSDEKLKSSLWCEADFLVWVDNYEKSYEDCINSKVLKISPELTYLFTYFQIFSLLIEDKNEINAGKCKHMHPYPGLLGILAESKRCWPLKRYVRAYVNRLYYTFDDFENVSQLFIEHDLGNIASDLQMIIELKDNWIEFKEVKLQNPVRYSYLVSYVYLYLEEVLISINTIMNKERFLNDLEDILQNNFSQQKFKVHLQLFDIASKLTVIRKQWNKSNYLCSFTQVLMNILKSVFRTFDIQLLLIREGLLNHALQMKSLTEKVIILRRRVSGDQIIEEQETIESSSDATKLLPDQSLDYITGTTDSLKEILIENIFNISEEITSLQSPQHIQLRLTQTMKKFIVNHDNEDDNNETLNFKHRRVINQLNLSARFQRFIDEEFIQVCEQLNNIDSFSKQIYDVNFPVITLKEFITNTIHMSINSGLKDDIKVFVLKMLTRMITQKADKEGLPIDQWTPEFWSDSKENIEKEQNFMEECGGAELICQFLKDPNLEQRMLLTSELLTFAIAFLIGGNPKCQDAILIKLREDQQNTMLQNYAIMVRKVGRSIYNNFKIRKIKNDGSDGKYKPFEVVMLDNQDTWEAQFEMLRRENSVQLDDSKETALKLQARDTLCRSYRVLQLLCENNNIEMKNFIRQQVDLDGTLKINTINFIEFTTTQLRVFLKIMNRGIISIVSFMLDFLIEVIQLPCLENQITLCKSTFLEDVCYMGQFFSFKTNLISRSLDQPNDFKLLQDLYNKILIAVMSVLEGNDEKIYEDLQNKLETRFLIDIAKSNLLMLNTKTVESLSINLQQESFKPEITKAVNVLIIKKKIMCRAPQSKWIQTIEASIHQNDPDIPEFENIIKFLDQQILNIEIIYQGRPQMIFFFTETVFHFLSDQTKEKIMYNVKRETQREKILGLLEAKEGIFKEIEYNFQLNQSAVPVTHKTIMVIRNIASAVSVLINLTMVLFYQVVVKNKTAYFVAEFHEEMVLALLSIAQLILSIALFMFYIMSRVPLVLLQNPQASKFEQIQLIIQTEDDFIQYLLYLLVSILGCLYKEYFFSLHLFDLFGRLSLLKNVFQAIQYNAKQLVVVSMLGVLFVYVFSITGFDNYVDEIYTEDEPDEYCRTLVGCMITLSTSGVIGAGMASWDPVKFLLDLLYFVFFALLFTNIVSGIMIDTFAELRDQRQKIEDDKKNYCFICGTDRQTTEKNGEKFQNHIEKKHYLWNYVFYIYSLTKKDSTEYTGLEYWISDRIKNEDIDWFPVVVENDNNIILNNFEQINQKIEQLEQFVIDRTEGLLQQVTQLEQILKQNDDFDKNNS